MPASNPQIRAFACRNPARSFTPISTKLTTLRGLGYYSVASSMSNRISFSCDMLSLRSREKMMMASRRFFA